MKKSLKHIEKYLKEGGCADCDGGRWSFPHNGLQFCVIASWGGGWDHVSVSTPRRTPTWDEMCHFKDLFFDPEEVVVQIHPAKTEYVNLHEHCLHLWRPQGVVLPVPPTCFVGPTTSTTIEQLLEMLRGVS